MQRSSYVPTNDGHSPDQPQVEDMPYLFGWCRRVLQVIRQSRYRLGWSLNSHKEKAGLRLKVNKCQFGVTTQPMLGHIVDQQGVRPNPEKVRAVQKFPRPTDVNSTQTFFGLCSYYRKFIPNFASLTRPLTSLTKSSTPFEWEEEQETSMQHLKKALIDTTILANLKSIQTHRFMALEPY